MKTRTTALVLLLLTCLVVQGADVQAHFAARPVDYSCDMSMSGARGVMTMRLFQNGEMKRSEMKRGEQHVVMIVRPDQQKILMIMPERKMIMSMPYDAKKAQDDVEQLSKDTGAKIEPLGTETIREVLCDKFATTGSDGRKAMLWIAQEQHTVQRWAAEDGASTIDFSNYQIGTQDAALFEPPTGYQLIAMPAGAPGQPAPAK